jgi:hypothetical protein
METWIVLALAILLELSVRIIPTKVNFSILDKVKNLALAIHNFVDIIIPNRIKDDELV